MRLQRERQAHHQHHDKGRKQRCAPRRLHVNGWYFGSRRKIVGLRLSENHKHRMSAANTCILRVIDSCIDIPARLQLLDAYLRLLPQVIDLAKSN